MLRVQAASAQHKMLVGRGEGEEADGTGGAAPWALPNVADVLAGMVQIGGGLIRAAKVPQAGHALRKAVA